MAVDRIALASKESRGTITTNHRRITPGQTLTESFEHIAAMIPQKVAVVHAVKAATYSDLVRMSDHIARHLDSNGVQRHDYVPVLLDRSILAVASILGVLKLGAICVPLEPDYPDERIRLVLGDCRAKNVITESKYLQREALNGVTTIEFKDTGKTALKQTNKQMVSNCSPNDIAFVFYTSGSSGTPKGVLLSHECCVSRKTWLKKHYCLDMNLNFYFKSSIGFDNLIREIFLPLICGGTIVVAEQGKQKDTSYLLREIINHSVTAANFTPSLLEAFLSQDMINSITTLKHVFIGGEVLTGGIVRKFRRLLPSCKMHNIYGATEALTVAYYECDILDDDEEIVPVGQPTDMTIYILDESRKAVPQGDVGEIYVAGPGLANGYLRRNELQKKAFVKNPIESKPDIAYRTGDYGRQLFDGNLILHGRTDRMVKLRGFRIELGEIEASLKASQLVNNAHVVVHSTPKGRDLLVAYVVPEQKDIGDLRATLAEWLRSRLPSYMVPAVIISVDKFLTNVNGKLDENTLPKPFESSGVKAIVAKVNPRTEAERRIMKLCCEVFEIADFSTRESFSNLGVDSLTIVKLSGELKKRFNLDVPVDAFIKNDTVELISRLLEINDARRSSNAVIMLNDPKEEKRPFFCVAPAAFPVQALSEIVRNFDDQRTFYGLQYYGLTEGEGPPYSQIESIASYFIQAIRKVQEHGPYLLGGMCIGGTVAFEMALQLAENGEDVPLLIVFETLHPPNYERLNVLGLSRRWYDLVKRWGIAGTVCAFLTYFERGASELRNRWKLKRANTYQFRRSRDVLKACIIARKNYFARAKYKGTVNVFIARDERLIVDHRKEWDNSVSGAIQYHHVPGDSMTFRATPNVKILSASLSNLLRCEN